MDITDKVDSKFRSRKFIISIFAMSFLILIGINFAFQDHKINKANIELSQIAIEKEATFVPLQSSSKWEIIWSGLAGIVASYGIANAAQAIGVSRTYNQENDK